MESPPFLAASACSSDTRSASHPPGPSDTITAVVSARIGSTGMVDEVDEYIFGEIQSVTAGAPTRFRNTDPMASFSEPSRDRYRQRDRYRARNGRTALPRWSCVSTPCRFLWTASKVSLPRSAPATSRKRFRTSYRSTQVHQTASGWRDGIPKPCRNPATLTFWNTTEAMPPPWSCRFHC